MGRMVYVREKKTKPYQPGHWSEKKKHEAVCLWLTGLSLTKVAIELNVPHETVRTWRTAKWWKEIADDIQSEDSQQMDARLTKILDKSLDVVMDRLENGEYIYDQRTGKIRQTPVKLRDANIAFSSLMDKRQLIRKQPTKITEQSSTAANLANLAKQFELFVTGKIEPPKISSEVSEIIEGETLIQTEDGSYELKE